MASLTSASSASAMPASASLASSSTAVSPSASIWHKSDAKSTNILNVVYAVAFGVACVLLIASIFLCGHRYQRRKRYFADDESFRDSTFMGRLKKPLRFLHVLFTPNIESRASHTRDLELNGVPPSRASTFPPLPSRTSTFDQRLPPYDPGHYVPTTIPITEEQSQSGAPSSSAGAGQSDRGI